MISNPNNRVIEPLKFNLKKYDKRQSFKITYIMVKGFQWHSLSKNTVYSLFLEIEKCLPYMC